MSSPSRRARALRRVAIAGALGVLLTFLPAPKFTFMQASFGSLAPFPSTEDAGASEVAGMQDVLDTTLVGDRVVGTEPATDEFTMIGVAFDEAPTEPVLVRVRQTDGTWSEWNELEYSGDDGPDRGTSERTARITTEPLWVGDAEGYQLSVADGEESGAEVALVRERATRVVTESTPIAEAAGSPAPFPIQPRSAWNVRSTSTSTTSALKMAVVHHTASTNAYSSGQVPSILRSMQAYHMDTKGWSDIAYNFLVDRFGTIWEGRGGGMGNAVIGAHAMGFNTGSVGVSVIGNFVGAGAPSVALEAVARVVGWRLEAYGVNPLAASNFTSGGSTSIPAGQVVYRSHVVGHQEVGSTSCPGSIQGSLQWVRNRARNWYDWTAAMHNPIGRADGVTGGDGVITSSGFAYDPDTSSPIEVILIVGGRWYPVTADRSRSDWATHYGSYGNNHGYAIGIEMPPGRYATCVVALNEGEGRDSYLSCGDVVVK